MFSERKLSSSYMYPSGCCTRSLDESVYQGIINNKRSTCALCGDPLSGYQKNMQHREHREIKHHFCPECLEYFALCHSKIVGEDMSFLVDESYGRSRHTMLPDPAPSARMVEYNNPNVIDAEFEEVTQRRPFALPPPEDSLKVPRNSGRQMYKGKEVEFVPLKRR